jgi:hypothetical protein
MQTDRHHADCIRRYITEELETIQPDSCLFGRGSYISSVSSTSGQLTQNDLIASLANSENVILVADRRFTFKRQPPDNEQNKIAVLWFDDARILAGFSGSATVDNFETHR